MQLLVVGSAARRILRGAVIGLVAVGWATAGLAQAPAPEGAAATAQPGAAKSRASDEDYPGRLARDVAQHPRTLERIRKAVERLQRDDAGLQQQRSEAQQLIESARLTKQELQPHLDTVAAQIKELGPPPKDKAPAEAPEIARERARLATIRGHIQAAQKKTDLTILRAQQLIARIRTLRLRNFSDDILRRSPSLVSPALWMDVGAALPRVGTQLRTIGDNWLSSGRQHTSALLVLLVIAIAAFVTLVRVRQRTIASRLAEPMDPIPGFFRRVATASWLVPVVAMPGAAAVAIFFLGADLIAVWDNTTRAFAVTVMQAALIVIVAGALATAIVIPSKPSWRLVGTPTAVSRRLLWISKMMAGVYATDYFLHSAIELFHMPIAIGVVETSLANLAFAALLVLFVWTPVPEDAGRASARLVRNALYWLRFPVLVVSVAIVASTLLGYVALGRFLAGQVMVTGIGGAFVLLLHLAIRALTVRPAEMTEPVERLIEDKTFLSDRRRGHIATVVAFVLNALLAIVAFAFLLLSWGFPYTQLIDGMEALFFGFQIGQFRISLFRILIGVGLFVAVLFVTRLVQRWLGGSVLSPQRMDAGIANSLHTGIGYLGMAIAALIGVSYAGFDLTNFTLVIGALSLGVGLGLQSIVNNFVSGIILLVERPIKVGDWIVVGDQQGYVRKISVRSTEIETFDRASVIMPNSDLISGTVQNWTHRNALGRVIVNVGVSYGADPHQVRDILLDVAKQNDVVLSYPEPFVVFEDFGASSLDFSLRCYIQNVTSSLSTKTALRMAIFDAFKAHDIEIPFPQQDVHLRDLDPVRSLLARMAEERMKTAPEAGTAGAPSQEPAQGSAQSGEWHDDGRGDDDAGGDGPGNGNS